MLTLSAEALAAHDAHRPAGPHHARCYAPFTSMYFDQFGNVLACCLNTMKPLGSYPKERIADIWEGAAAGKLRAALANDDFSQGCQNCHNSIASGNFSAINELFDLQVESTSETWLADHPSVSEDRRDQWPRMLEFAVSTRCNLTCTMCSGYCSSAIRKKEGLDPLPELYGEEFVAEIRPFLEHVEMVKFYGGEPFLSPVNFSIWESLCEVNPTCRVAITTNGTIWNDRVRRVVETLDCSISVSIDAYEPATFEAIRQGASYERVHENLRQFSQVEGCQVSLTACAMRQNWREIPDLVRLANANDWNLGFNVVRYPQDHSLSSSRADELEQVVELWDELIATGSPPGSTPTAQANLARLDNILSEAREWLAAAAAGSGAVEVRPRGEGVARQRRRDWLELVGTLAAMSWNDLAERSEDGFRKELGRLLDEFDRVVAPKDQGSRLALAIAGRSDEPATDERVHRFSRFGTTLGSAPVVPRVLLMADIPPADIAQAVGEQDPDVMALRLDSYFPPRRPEPES